MRLLLVEEDAELASSLCRELALDGHELTVASAGAAAPGLVTGMRPDVVILDIGMNTKGEMNLVSAIRERCRVTSVLVLTGRAEIEQTVMCLELGADDVMHKPLSLEELKARLRALERRRGQFGDRVLRSGDLEMDRAARRVTQGDREVDLTATEFSLLESLLRRRGRVCSRSELLREVWGVPKERDAGANVVEVYINYLRRKLGGDVRRSGKAWIRTVRGQGYVLDEGNETEAARPWIQVDPLSAGIKKDGPRMCEEGGTSRRQRDRAGMELIGKELHELCQPLTVLQCGLELAGITDMPVGYQKAVTAGLNECARVAERVRAMREIVRATLAEAEASEKLPYVGMRLDLRQY